MGIKHYYLSSGSFNADVSSFGIHEFKKTGTDNGTKFVREGQAYATAEIRYAADGREAVLVPHDPVEMLNEPEGPIEEAARNPAIFNSTEGRYFRKGHKCSVTFSFKDDILLAETEYATEGETLRQKLTVTNRSNREAEICDLSVFLPTNSVFVWEESAARQIIGHHFVSGHGSFSILKRCDGEAPHLMMIPQEGTAFEYWELKAGRYAKIDEVENTYRNKVTETYSSFFIHSKHAAAKAVQMGSKLRRPVTSRVLAPGESAVYTWAYLWVEDDGDARDKLVSHGLPDVRSVPGYTVPIDMNARMAVRCRYGDLTPEPEFPGETRLIPRGQQGGYTLFDLKFSRLGENQIRLRYDNGRKWMNVEYFVTQPLPALLEKRADFLTRHQCHDREKWYRGLLCEWDNEEQKEVTPDDRGRIKGWFIFAVCSDDPGLAKPAFLSSKIAEQPAQAHVDAMDEYIEYFVWGGLQMRDDEEYPYGVYGIPDWHTHRANIDPENGIALMKPDKTHIWRVYDYPHIFLMYFNMYRTARNYPSIKTRLTAEVYLERAFRTALALFTWPLAMDAWSADTLGLYGECCIPGIVAALKAENRPEAASELERHWARKARYFISKMQDLFVSEIAVDTTDFESTYALAKYAAEAAAGQSVFQAHPKDIFNRRNRFLLPEVMDYMQRQMRYNTSCRGTIEPAYYYFGSDYRGRNNAFTLSYMSQMGGWSLLDQALWYEENPYELLRLGYAGTLSSWALLNSGNEESGYGYWYPGKANDGAAGGGFEPAPYGSNWLNMPHHRGCWSYSCEIDIGFAGGIRGMSTVLANDPIFGWTVYGGEMKDLTEAGASFYSREAVRRRLHIIFPEGKRHIILDKGKISDKDEIFVSADMNLITFTVDCSLVLGRTVTLRAESDTRHGMAVTVEGCGWKTVENGEGETLVSWNAEAAEARVTVACRPRSNSAGKD